MYNKAYIQPVFLARCDVCNVEQDWAGTEEDAVVWKTSHNGIFHVKGGN